MDNKLSEIIWSVVVMAVLTGCGIYVAYTFSNSHMIELPNEKQVPQVEQGLIELKKVGE